MKTLKELYPNASPLLPIYVKAEEENEFSRVNLPIGIEIEAENTYGTGVSQDEALEYYAKADMEYWEATTDGSLRNRGLEFRLALPLSGWRIKPAIKEIEDLGGNWEFSHRTGTHIHVDVSNYTRKKLFGLFTAYLAVEPFFFAVTDEKRKANAYCKPWASIYIGDLINASLQNSHCSSDEFLIKALIISTDRYKALSFTAIPKQLTVEFRMFEGTVSYKKLSTFVLLCTRLVYFSGRTPNSIIRDLILEANKRREANDLVREVFGNISRILPKLSYKDLQTNLECAEYVWNLGNNQS